MMIPVAEAVISQLREGIRQKKDKLRARENAIFQLEEVNKRQKTNGGACEMLLSRFKPRFFLPVVLKSINFANYNSANCLIG